MIVLTLSRIITFSLLVCFISLVLEVDVVTLDQVNAAQKELPKSNDNAGASDAPAVEFNDDVIDSSMRHNVKVDRTVVKNPDIESNKDGKVTVSSRPIVSSDVEDDEVTVDEELENQLFVDLAADAVPSESAENSHIQTGDSNEHTTETSETSLGSQETENNDKNTEDSSISSNANSDPSFGPPVVDVLISTPSEEEEDNTQDWKHGTDNGLKFPDPFDYNLLDTDIVDRISKTQVSKNVVRTVIHYKQDELGQKRQEIYTQTMLNGRILLDYDETFTFENIENSRRSTDTIPDAIGAAGDGSQKLSTDESSDSEDAEEETKKELTEEEKKGEI